MSKEILDSNGRALKLNADEYIHMMNLARFPVQPPESAGEISISAGVHKMIGDLAYPAIVVSSRADVLAWNAAACSYFADFPTIPEKERNMLWQWFTNQSLQSRIVDWEERSQYAVAVFRGFYDRHAEDPWFPRFDEELMGVSPFFQTTVDSS